MKMNWINLEDKKPNEGQQIVVQGYEYNKKGNPKTESWAVYIKGVIYEMTSYGINFQCQPYAYRWLPFEEHQKITKIRLNKRILTKKVF